MRLLHLDYATKERNNVSTKELNVPSSTHELSI